MMAALLNKGNEQFEDSGLTIPLISTWPKPFNH